MPRVLHPSLHLPPIIIIITPELQTERGAAPVRKPRRRGGRPRTTPGHPMAWRGKLAGAVAEMR